MRDKKLTKLATKVKNLLVEELLSQVQQTATSTANKVIYNKLQAIQAIDFGFKDSGKIIIAAKVNGHDHVKIIDIPKNMTLQDYKYLSKKLEQEYGAEAKIFDMPVGLPWKY